MAANQQIDHLLRAWKFAAELTAPKFDHPFTDAQLVFHLPHSRTHILWLAGHLSIPIEWLVNRAVFGRSTVPDKYMALFGRDTQPMADVSAYPPLSELLEFLSRTRAVAMEEIARLDEPTLLREYPGPERLRERFGTVGGALTFLPIHESYHAGQLELLRRAQGIGVAPLPV